MNRRTSGTSSPELLVQSSDEDSDQEANWLKGIRPPTVPRPDPAEITRELLAYHSRPRRVPLVRPRARITDDGERVRRENEEGYDTEEEKERALMKTRKQEEDNRVLSGRFIVPEDSDDESDAPVSPPTSTPKATPKPVHPWQSMD